MPAMQHFATGVSVSTLISALIAIYYRKVLHPWIRNTLDGGLLSLNLAIGFVSRPVYTRHSSRLHRFESLTYSGS